MYGIDKNLDLSYMLGKEFLQYCIGIYQIIMHFSGGLSITVESHFRIKTISGCVLEASNFNSDTLSELSVALGAHIMRVERINKREMSIVFSNGVALTLIDANTEGESFTIVTPHQEIIV